MLLLLFWYLTAVFSPHPIHLTVMEIYSTEKSKNLECSLTFFADDFARAIHYENYAPQIQSGKLRPEDLILRYLRSKLHIKVNGKSMDYGFLRAENTHETVTCFLRINLPAVEARQIVIENKLMLELFEDQRNLIQIRIPGKKEGALSLDKSQTGGIANLSVN